ncbi:sugar ABC transporter substrate-binding protein [Alkalibacterium sp. f15]|uniref:sugar ABC transporter substrate-binding protein n=1 Tax=Alkalibacterium sp. f15 TaxID=3414029 RepID=UPI003BF790C0
MFKSKLLKSLALGTGILLVTACGTDSEGTPAAEVEVDARYEIDESTPAWKIDPKEEMTELTWYVNASWWNDSFGDDVVTKKIKEDLNVDITFITGDDTNLNTMFAGDEMADMVTIFDFNSQVAQQAETWAYSLNDLADQYDPYWYEASSDETLDWYQLDNGKSYGYPSYSNTSDDYESGLIPANTGFLIRKDVYEKIGEPSFSTPEEFNENLSKINEEFPELTPFGFNTMEDGAGSLGGTFQNFLGVPIEDEDGSYYNRNLDDSYLTWIGALREAHTNGNLSDDSFADDSTTFEEKIGSGEYATIMSAGTAQMSGFLQSFMASNPDAQYIAIDGPQSTVGNEPTLNQSGITGWMINYISQEASDPAKAMQVFTYLQSEEGQLLTTYGIEGETYEYNDEGKIELLPEIQELRDNDADSFKQEIRIGEFIFFGHDKYQSLASESNRTPALIQPREWGEGKLKPQFILENTDPEPGSAEARTLTSIDAEWVTTLVGLIRSGSEDEFNTILENHKQFLEDNNMESIEQVRTEKMNENRERLGIE